jgi:bifunctional enzyme CysN/CysC
MHTLQPKMQPPLRFVLCGAVDDGKSTLLGRLMAETGNIYADQLDNLVAASKRFGSTGDATDFALLTDGLEAERAQGITIDVAYRYFATERRSFIAADAPGHEQYTRNMITAGSTAEAAVVLVDATKGLGRQTRRHITICHLLGIRHILLAINKVDAIAFDQAAFEKLRQSCAEFCIDFAFTSITTIPISARRGDNVSSASARLAWSDGPTLLSWLETVPVAQASDHATAGLRFPVQWMARGASRSYSGTLMSGQITQNQQIIVARTGQNTQVKRIVTFDGERTNAQAGDAITVELADELDIGRGDLLHGLADRPIVSNQFNATIVWLDGEPLFPGRLYRMLHATHVVDARILALKDMIDIDTRAPCPASSLAPNDIGRCDIHTSAPLAFDPHETNPATGSFILIDRETSATVGAGMIRHALRRATNVHRQVTPVTKASRATLMGQRPCVIWFTGLSGAGKSTIAGLVEQRLHALGMHSYLLDGDNLRLGLNRDLGFTAADRVENIRRVGEVAALMADAGLVVLCAFISPYASERRQARDVVGAKAFFEVFIDTPIDVCVSRDPKGLYRRAIEGKIENFTGISAAYEPPVAPDLRIDGSVDTPEIAASRVIDAVLAWQAQNSD